MMMFCFSTNLLREQKKTYQLKLPSIFSAKKKRSEARSLEELLPVKTLPGPGDPQVIGWMM